MQHSAKAVAWACSSHKKVVTVWHQMFRGKVSIIKQIADSPALFTAGAMNVHILEILNMIKAVPVWRWSRLPWCACVCNYIIMKTLTPLNLPQALVSEPTLYTDCV